MTAAPSLLPDRCPPGDFFVGDILDAAPMGDMGSTLREFRRWTPMSMTWRAPPRRAGTCG